MDMIKIRFSEEAKQIYDFLEKQARTSKKERIILNSLKAKLDSIKKDPHYGSPIRKKLIPSYYRIKYSANNLFRIELPQFWRMLYTLTNSETEIEIIAFVLDVLDHEDYDKKFGYIRK
jgi:hypothetical protein